MTRHIILVATAGAMLLAPALAVAAPPSGGAGGTATTTTPSATGNGGGYNHSNSPAHTTGQPMQSCQTTGTPPGGSATAPGSAFSGGTADTKYAGTQPQNSRNSASVSQYDVACANQPH